MFNAKRVEMPRSQEWQSVLAFASSAIPTGRSEGAVDYISDVKRLKLPPSWDIGSEVRAVIAYCR